MVIIITPAIPVRTIYKVDSIIYNDFDPLFPKTLCVHVSERSSMDTFTDNLGRNARMIERFTTDDLTHPWVFDRSWYFIKKSYKCRASRR